MGGIPTGASALQDAFSQFPDKQWHAVALYSGHGNNQPNGSSCVQNGIHFVSGLPRAGSTSLAAFAATELAHARRHDEPGREPVLGAVTADEPGERSRCVYRRRPACTALRDCFGGYYADIHREKLVFDTNRQWTTKLPALVELFPDLRMVCCIRKPA